MKLSVNFLGLIALAAAASTTNASFFSSPLQSNFSDFPSLSSTEQDEVEDVDFSDLLPPLSSSIEQDDDGEDNLFWDGQDENLPWDEDDDDSLSWDEDDMIDLTEDIQENAVVNLRHRQLGSSGLVKFVFDTKKCWDIAYSRENDLILHGCHGGWNQQFNWESSSQRIRVGKELCLDYNWETNNVYGHPCHSGSNQKWWFDKLGRIRTKRDNKCLDVRDKNIYMNNCCDKCEGQRYFFPKAFPLAKSDIRPFYNQKQCFDIGGGDNLHVYEKCHGGDWQQFYYSENREHIIVADGRGCLSENKGKVYAYKCHDGKNQRFWFDTLGRIHNRLDESKCLEAAKNKNGNMKMVKCSGSSRQRFVKPDAFPKVNSAVVNIRDSKCMAVDTKSHNAYLTDCKGGNLQNFYFVPGSQQIYVAKKGYGCLSQSLKTSAVFLYKCHGGMEQKWFADRQGRLHSKEHSDKCLTVDRKNHNDLIMQECGDSMDQTFFLPSSFGEMQSVVMPVFNQDQCWDAHGGTGSMILYECHGLPNQSFLYLAGSKKIILNYKGSKRCVDGSKTDVTTTDCKDGSGKRWWLDQEGRLRNDAQSSKCLTSTKEKEFSNLIMEDCSGKDNQRFFPLPAGVKVQPSVVKPYYNASLCWDIESEKDKNLQLGECDGEDDQNFFFVPESERIVSTSGLCLDQHLEEEILYLHACHGGINQKWFADDRGRLHSSRDGRCLEVNAKDKRILLQECSEEDTQRFIYSESFVTVTSPVAPYADLSKCWEVDPETKNLYLDVCKGQTNQDYFYIPETEHIFVASGEGCLDHDPKTGNVMAKACLTQDNQKWYLDSIGRIHSRQDTASCLGVDKSDKNNLRMELCSDSLSQRFSFPNSFPIVSTDARTAHAKRQELNSLYGETNRQVFGEKTRSILRYQHPDQVQRNLCPYWESGYEYKYTMQNYKISTGSVIEVKYTGNMKQMLYGGSSFSVNSTASFLVTKPLNVLRPQQQDGWFRLGDYVSNKADGVYSAPLVKGDVGTAIKKPEDFELVWNVTSATVLGAFWRPVAPEGYKCLGHVWQEGDSKPSAHTVRCLQDRFVETVSSSLTWDNSGDGPNSDGAGSLWAAASTATSMTPGTFLSKASHSAPADNEFYALRKKCIKGLGSFPFCGTGDNLQLAVDGFKELLLPYAKLKPCYYHDEDQLSYGLVNEDDSKWENHAFELYEYTSGRAAYKHVGASNHLNASYCLGSVVFGSSEIKNDLFMHSVERTGSISQEEAEVVRKGKIGAPLSKLIDGDFVFLFPCTNSSAIKEYKKDLQQLAKDANVDGTSENGLVNGDEDLGEVMELGSEKWAKPHYCGLSEEPTESGGCKMVDFCFFEPGGCKPYDQLPCKEDDDCKGGFCAEDGLCGKNVRLYDDSARSTIFQKLPRALSYGIGQDGPGRFLVKAEGNQVQLGGNVWKAFPVKSHTVRYNTILEFDFRLVDEAEGHAICVDEDLNEDVEIRGAKRCFRLAGTQDDVWTEVWKLSGPGPAGEYKHFKIPIGSITGGPGNDQPYISWGTSIKYLALVQDNDENENVGLSVFRNLQLYDDDEMAVEKVDPGPQITGDSITIEVDNTKKNSNWNLQCTRLDGAVPDQPPQSVYKWDKTTFKTSSASTFKHKLDGLLSGYEYTIKVFPEGKKDALQETVASTHCCCDCDSNIVGDTTGRPIGMTAYQVDGHVMFNFTDNSRCAEAYAFTRSALEDEFFDNSDETRKSVFTPNYNYYPKKKCGMAPVLPGKAASDDLKVSELEVGKAYRYCVRAVAQFYSSDAPHSSDENCNIHFVRWQASMSGKIITEPLAGSLPIEDVAVSWELLNPEKTLVIASGSAVTKRPGTFSIEFDELHKSLDRDSEFPVRIKFAKTTVVGDDHIQHQFLCNEGAIDCTDNGHIVYLKHLTFDEPIVSYDNSSVPVRGRVNIWEPDGCPVIGAEVCLKIKHTKAADTEGACVKTDHNGEYNVPAAIGSTVGIEVTYHNHTIVKAPENSLDYGKGLFIRVDKRYERNDFVDKERATLIVEVAGGLCNKTLGTSDLELTINGCQSDHWKMDLRQQFFRGEHWVPAHVVKLKVRDMQDEDGNDFSKILDNLYEEERVIDLKDAEEMEEEEKQVASNEDEEQKEEDAEKKKADEEKIKKVRFQYDGDMRLDFIFMGNDMAGDCTLQTIQPQGTIISDQQTSSSFHVTPTGGSFRPHLFIKYELLPELTCDIVSDDHSVRLINKVGIDNDFEGYAPTLKDKPKLLERLELCSDDGGCNFKVDHDMLGGQKVNANMLPKSEDGTILSFVAGRPNIYGDYRKDLTVEVLDKDLNIIKRHKAEVVVVGDYVKGPGASFALPTYQPILVLRDPPGGMSQAVYENVESTVKVQSSSVERVLDTEFGYDHKIGFAGDIDFCAGLGAMACKAIFEVEASAKIGGEITGNTKVTQNEDSYTSEFTTTWSFSTSDDPIRAGRDSDVIVIPNLNVQYHTVEKIAFFEDDACLVNTTEVVKFSLTDPGNKPALSFLSVYNIENHQIPDLKKAIDNKQAEHDKLEKGDGKKKKAKKQLETLKEALMGWESTMASYEKTNQLAKNGGLDIAAREWFSKWVSKHDMLDKEPSITDHWSNLAPESLTDSAVAFDFDYIKEANLASTNKDDIKQTNRIQFSGGGGTMEYQTHHKGASELLRLDPKHFNKEISVAVNIGADVTLKAGATFGAELGSKFQYTDSTSGTITNEHGRETSISFVLGDEQPNDEFVVDIYVDPVYGTFVFQTISGRSRAPHEANTLKGEDLRISMDRPARPVMPDEAIVFDITLGNDGESLAVFQAAVDHTSNPGGLRHHMGGVGMEVAIDYQMDSRSEVITKLEITRGPKDYIYPATTLEFGGDWDEKGIEAVAVELWNYIDGDNNKWIKFEEPCPTIEWSGALKREMKASVIKDMEPVELTVYNPRKASGSFEDMAKNGRLENVHVLYRELGDPEWQKALLPDHTPIDFASIPDDKKAWKESVYGYSRIPWDIGRILALTADGTYEVMVKSYCTELSGAPAEFNAYATDPIILTVDRVLPELYGKALPVRDVVVPGEEVAMIFTENIRCSLPYRFDLEVRVSGLEDKFDERNLKIDCKDRKLGFQFDPVRIPYGLLMGREMTVTVDNVQDIEGNPIKNKITFTKTIANLNLADVSTSFDFTLDTPSCSKTVDESSIRDKIAAELAMDYSDQVNIASTWCKGKRTVAKVKISASSEPSQRRLRNDRDTQHALGAFYSLLNAASDENESGGRKLMSLDGKDPVAFSVSDLEVFPGEADVQQYDLNFEPTPEEEIILAAAEGCDSHSLEQREHMFRMEKSVKEQLNDTQSHMDKTAQETASHINELEMHLDMLDHKLDRILDKPRSTGAMDTSSHTEEMHGSSELADLLIQIRKEQQQAQALFEQQQAQMRNEQHQAHMWNLCFGVFVIAAMGVSLYATKRRN